MAFMNQEKKAVIAAALKKVMPKDWKYSLRCTRHSITCTIRQAPVDLLGMHREGSYSQECTSLQLNPYYLRSQCSDSATADVLEAIKCALNTGNWDNSDVMTDYFDVGHYIHIHVGEWNKPFIFTAGK